MAYVPDEAVRARKRLSHGAWDLYVLYCTHRNRSTGQCNPSNETLAREMECTKQHLSACKRELIDEKWIALKGRYDVALLKGRFDPLKVLKLENSMLTIKNNLNLDEENSSFRPVEIKNNLNPDEENSSSHIRMEPTFEPTVSGGGGESYARAREAAEVVPPPAPPATQSLEEPVDQEFVEQVKATGEYAAEIVEQLAKTLLVRLAVGERATKRMFLAWLPHEVLRRPLQPELACVAATVHELPARAPPDSPAVTAFACELCLDTGVSVAEEGSGQRCACAAASTGKSAVGGRGG